MEIAVEVEPEAWGPSADTDSIIRLAAEAALAVAAGPRQNLAVAILLTSDAEVADLNQRYRSKTGPTNVLSFPAGVIPGWPEGEAEPLGDIVLAAGVIRREAQEQGKSPADHLRHLVVHGMLHLLGHDHDTEQNTFEMQGLELAALKRLDIGGGGQDYWRVTGADDSAPADR